MLLRLLIPLVQFFVDVRASFVETKGGILFQDLVAIEIERVRCLSRSVGVFSVLQSVVCNAKDVLDQRQVRPRMIQHRLQIVVAVQENHDAALGRRGEVWVAVAWLLDLILTEFIVHFCQPLSNLDAKPVALLQFEDGRADS